MAIGTRPSEKLASDDWRAPSAAELSEAYAAAAATTGVDETVEFELGGRVFALRFASHELKARMTRSLQHLAPRTSATAPDLVLRVWDSSTGGLQPPPCPASARDGEEQALYHFAHDSVEGVYQRGPRALSVFDSTTRSGWYWVADERAVTYIEAAKPFRLIFNWWLSLDGARIVHAGAVAHENRGILLAGRSGSGKSTTTLACLAAGFSYAGDDYVVARSEPEPRVLSLYSVGKLEESHLRNVPALADATQGSEWEPGEKRVLFVNEQFPDRVPRSGFPLKAIVVPHVAGTESSSFRRASPVAALGALAPSTLFELPARQQAALSTMTALVRQVPVFELECGRDIAHLPDVLRRLLDGCGP